MQQLILPPQGLQLHLL